MLTCIRSKRQRNAAEYALRAIQSSCIKPYIKTIYLYGSCARGEEKYSSDVDLFLELSESFRSRPELKKYLYLLKSEVSPFIKLQIKGGAANPSPPVGPALGSKGVNIMDFCKQFNARTQDKAGKVLPVIITVYSDKSFDFVVKQPPVAIQLKEAAKVQKGSAQPNRDKVGQVTWDQIREIAQDKMPDMNCFTLESAMRMVAGTARSMGINVVGEFPNM